VHVGAIFLLAGRACGPGLSLSSDRLSGQHRSIGRVNGLGRFTIQVYSSSVANIETHIEGSEKLICIFGRWPSFHDAEVVDLNLWRGDSMTDRSHPRFPVLTAKIHLWELTDEIDARGYYVLRNHTLATLRFHDVLDLKIAGFSNQNVIFGLAIGSQEFSEGPWKRSFAVDFESVAEFGATFRCSRIEVVDALPWT